MTKNEQNTYFFRLARMQEKNFDAPYWKFIDARIGPPSCKLYIKNILCVQIGWTNRKITINLFDLDANFGRNIIS